MEETMTMMVKRWLAVVTVGILTLCLTPPAHAEDTCSDATLNGDFGFSIAGHNLASWAEFAYVGRFTADGSGSFSGAGVASTDGTIQRLAFTGKYSVASNCTGSATLSYRPGLVIKLEYVLVDGGKEGFVLVADAGVVEYGSIKRIGVRTTAPTAPAPGDRPKR
jgi:hypothetical protein